MRPVSSYIIDWVLLKAIHDYDGESISINDINHVDQITP